MNGGHRRAHTSRKLGMDFAAGWPRESQAAAVKRAQSHSVSSSFEAVVVSSDSDEDGVEWKRGAGEYGKRFGACVGWEVDVGDAGVVEEVRV